MSEETEDLAVRVGTAPNCAICGSVDVVRAGWAMSDPVTESWVPATPSDDVVCKTCEATGIVARTKSVESKGEAVRDLNDALRTGNSRDGIVMITPGIQARGCDFVKRAASSVAAFNAFDPNNDPHEEHDYGVVVVAGDRLFFKIDYFDLAMQTRTPDPTNSAVTRRVLMIMLAGEF